MGEPDSKRRRMPQKAKCLSNRTGSDWLSELPEAVRGRCGADAQQIDFEPNVASDLWWCSDYLRSEVSHTLPLGTTLTVKQASVEEMHFHSRNATHGTVWRGSVVMAKYLQTLPRPAPGTRLIEVGCGCALAGMSAAAVGYTVQATDRADCLEQAQHAATDPRNTSQWAESGGSVEVREIDWLKPDTYAEPAGLVVGCDIVYAKQYHLPLLECLASIVAPDGKALLATQVRHPLREIPFFDLARMWFEVRDVNLEGAGLTEDEQALIYIRELIPLPPSERRIRFPVPKVEPVMPLHPR